MAINSEVQQVTGAGEITFAAQTVSSISLVVTAGSVDVTISNDSAVSVPVGASLTWSSGNKEFLDDDFVFDAADGSFIVTATR